MIRALLALALVVLCACTRKDPPEVSPAALEDVSILASSELAALAPRLEAEARAAGLRVQWSYAGTLEIVERVDRGERFDMVLPSSGAYPSLALTHKPLARDKLFYSRVALGVKESKAEELVHRT